MRHRDVFYHYAPFIAEVPKSVPGELSTQISDDAVGYAETVDDLVKERDSLFLRMPVPETCILST